MKNENQKDLFWPILTSKAYELADEHKKNVLRDARCLSDEIRDLVIDATMKEYSIQDINIILCQVASRLNALAQYGRNLIDILEIMCDKQFSEAFNADYPDNLPNKELKVTL